MAFTDTQIAALSADLSRAHVKGRQQAGRTLSYIESWHAIAEANRIFGFDGWQSETVECRMVSERERGGGKEGWAVSYVARVRVTVWAGKRRLVREGVGAGHGIDRDLGQAHESAIKEAESDSRKRALMTFGNPFGLALYDKTQASVTSDPPDRTPAAKPSPERQERIAAAHEADPHRAAMLAVTRGSDPALSDDEPDPANDERPVPDHLLKTATATTVSVSAKLRGEMIDALREVYTAKQLASWEKLYGKGSGKPDSLTRLDRDEVVKVWKLKQQAVKPNGAVGGRT